MAGNVDRGLEALNVELTNQTSMIDVVQQKVDKMKADLGISDIEIQQGYTLATVESEALRKQDAVRIEARSEYEKLNTQFSKLTTYTRVEIKRAMLTVVPDLHLATLLQQLTTEELTNASGRAAVLANDKSRDHATKIRELYLLAFSRPPQADEAGVALAHLEKHKDAPQRAYEDNVWALINQPEFYFNH